MNAIFFGAKRAFHSTLHLTRKLLAQMGLTAARFDMLMAIDSVDEGMSQRLLRDMLGVTAATVSRMVRSLEELGLVARERIAADRRQLLVRLTVAGRRLIRRASRLFIYSGAIQLAVDYALCDSQVFDPRECHRRMSNAEILFLRLQDVFHRGAYLSYPWRRDA
jgi:DNA-binding MarR family transcriptional regulator